jgi:putative ABC transport system ATP-binding protein
VDVELEAHGIRKVYMAGYGQVEALRGIDLTVPKGDFVALMGPSGCGKTTLLSILGGLEPPSSGVVLLSGRDIQGLTQRERLHMRRFEVGFIFQGFHLVRNLTALENVMLPLGCHGWPEARQRVRAEEILAVVGLEARGRHFPSQLSGGEQQRVAIARAIANEPRIILGDEPTGNLDERNTLEVLELFGRLNRDLGQTFVMATHNPLFLQHCSRVITMRDGALAR